jgi:phosphatidylserine decarboxylase
MTIARWGIPVLVGAIVLFAWTVWLLPSPMLRGAIGGVLALAWLFMVWFFRNPRRTPASADPRDLIAPADGVVADIETLHEGEFLSGDAVRIGIFLSVFDVHVNRSPVAAQVAYARHRPGAFLDARDPDAATDNEANSLGLVVDPAVRPDTKLLVRQISGLIARRIICTHGVGDRLGRGELYGMIRFGSRTELWIPAGIPHTVLVKPGDRVRGGETVIARLLP